MSLPASVTALLQQSEQAASSPVFVDVISMAGPSNYGTDVWNKAAIQTLLRKATGDGRTIFAIMCGYAGATYYAEYDPVNDAVKVTVKSTGVENATANISGTTFTFICISK